MAKGRQARATHPRNRYAESAPDFAALASLYPSFAQYVRINHRNGRGSIDWTDYDATRELTRILLEHDYGVKWWIPDGQLCPTVTNRANYIHWIEDLLHEFPVPGKPDDEPVSGVDIGTGANCIYPLLGASMLGWKFVGTDITDVALEWAKKNLEENPQLQSLIEVRSAAGGSVNASSEERNDSEIFEEVSGGASGVDSALLVGVVKEDEKFDFCMCNPPFFESIEQAGLNPRTACGGTLEEMVCPGGETDFITRLIADSVQLKTRVHWYTTMVGKKASLKILTAELRRSGASRLKTTEFVQGKTSRWGLAWTFSESGSKVFSTVATNKGGFSFMLDGMDRQCSALDVLHSLKAYLEAGGASCEIDATIFTVSGTIPGDENVTGKRTRDGSLVQASSIRNDATNVLKFKATVFQQSPGCLLVKGSIINGERATSARLLSALQKAESALREQFVSKVRQKEWLTIIPLHIGRPDVVILFQLCQNKEVRHTSVSPCFCEVPVQRFFPG